MERLLHSPGRTREEYQTARPSSQHMSRTAFTYGTTIAPRGREIVSDFGGKSVDAFANKFAGMPGRKVSEKELLQGLNDRFAGFIEKVHHLENQNRALEREIEGIRRKATSSASLSNERECELNDLRRQVHEITLQKHQIEINRQNLEDDFNALRDKFDRETRGRVGAQDNITVLKKCISDAYLTKQAMDRKAIALEDEIRFLKANHESEVAEMMVQMQDSQVIPEKSGFIRSDLTAALKDIRMKLEGHTASDTRYAEERFRAQLAKLTKAAEVNREALMATKAEIQGHRRQLQSKNIELDSVKGVREALEKQLYDLEQRHNAEIHHYQDTMRELEFELNNAKYEMSSYLREYQDLLSVKMGLDAEIYSYRKLLEGEESRYSTISDAHITVPYIYRQSPIYTLPCVTRQGGVRRAEPQYKFVEEIITETTSEDVELLDTGSEKSVHQGDQPVEYSDGKDTGGDVSQEVKNEEPEAAVEDSDRGNPKVDAEEDEVKPAGEKEDVEDKPYENTTDDSELHQDMGTDSKPTQDENLSKNAIEEKDKEKDTENVKLKDLKDDMKRETEIAQSDVPGEDNVTKTDEPAKEAGNDVPESDPSEVLSVEKSDKSGPEEKTLEPPHTLETTAQVNNKHSEEVVKVTSHKSEDDRHKDAIVTSQESKTATITDKEKETTPVKSVDVNAPTLNPQPVPENTENGQKTASGHVEDKSKNISSPKNEISGTANKEAKKSELVEKDQCDTRKISEAEKPIEKPHKEEEKPKESTKKEESKVDGLIDLVITEKGEGDASKITEAEKPIEKPHKEEEEPKESTKKEDSKVDGLIDLVITEKGEGDASKITEAEKPIEKPHKEEEEPKESTKKEDSKVDGLIDLVITEKGEGDASKITEAEKPIEKPHKEEEKPKESTKKEDNKVDGLIDLVITEKGEGDASKITEAEKPIEKPHKEEEKPKESTKKEESKVDGLIDLVITEKGEGDASKITEAEKPIEKPHKEEEKPKESTKKEDNKVDGLIDLVITEKGEGGKSNAAEKPQEEPSKVAVEKSKSEMKQEDSKDSRVKTSEGETKVTEEKVDETQSNEAPKAKEPKPDAKPVQKETRESEVKKPEKTETAVKTEGPQTDSGNTKDVKSEETVPKESKQADSGAHEVKAVVSDTATKPEAKAPEKTSKEDSVNMKGPGETGKAL